MRKLNWFLAARYAVAGMLGLMIGYVVGLLLNCLAIGLSLVLGKTLALVICIPMAICVGYFDAKYTMVLVDKVDNWLTRWYNARRTQNLVTKQLGGYVHA
jgi:uncharacterized membrane protein